MNPVMHKCVSFPVLLAVLFGLAASPSPVRAAGAMIQVNSAADVQADDGVCTLREAVIAANTNTASGASAGECAAGSPSETDTITFAADYTITLSLGSELLINSAVNIEGNGRSATIIQAAACDPVADSCPQNHRVLRVDNPGVVTLKSLTIRHGRCAGSCTETTTSGAGILNQNFLTLDNVAIQANFASGSGGGVQNLGTLTVTNSLFQGNKANNRGGGINAANDSGYGGLSVTGGIFSLNTASMGGAIYNSADDGMTITASNFSTNSASFQGGALFYEVDTLISNSVFFDNNAENNGGAIYHKGSSAAPSKIVNSTFTANRSNLFVIPDDHYGGGAIFSSGYSELQIYNSTLYNNTNGGLYLWNGEGTQATEIYNTIIGNNTNGDCVFDGIGLEHFTGDIYNIDTDGSCENASTHSVSNLRMGVFDAYGGATPVIPLLYGSPAIDSGDPAVCADVNTVNNKDQREVTRPLDGNGDGAAVCDAGAFEAQILVARSQAANDGWILESSETTNAGGSLSASGNTLNVGDDAQDRQYRAILSFNTTLPGGAVITSATLKFKYAGKTGALPFSATNKLLVDVKKVGFSNNAALQKTDFQAAANKASLFAFGSSAGWFSKVFSPGQLTYINKTGFTQFRLRFTKDDNDNGIADFIKIYSGSAAAANRPQLIVEYYVP